jgi:hypothetical protein
MARPVVGILPLVFVVAGLSLFGQKPTSPSESGVRAGTANVDGIQLQYAIRGAGEPVVLVHAGCFAD